MKIANWESVTRFLRLNHMAIKCIAKQNFIFIWIIWGRAECNTHRKGVFSEMHHTCINFNTLHPICCIQIRPRNTPSLLTAHIRDIDTTDWNGHIWTDRARKEVVSVLAQGADLALAASPLAAGVGQTHHHVPAFPVRGAQSLEDLVWDEWASRADER